MEQIAAIVLAGGRGKRMQSAEKHKTLHEIGNQPMIFYTLNTLNKINLAQTIVVVGHQAEQVKRTISDKFNVEFAHQEIPLGTADALRAGLTKVNRETQTLIVLNGDDSAFYSQKTLENFINSHQQTEAVLSALTLKVDESINLGRIIRDSQGNFDQILELNEYLQSGLKGDEINCGCYVMNVEWLLKTLPKIKKSQTGEYYITDLLNLAKKQQEKINLVNLKNKEEWVGVNTPEELKKANVLFQEKEADQFLQQS
jgi:bifunctional UDP-N-acetylglucosamine pyrophosphorylase / glucosamine-1-phosphate N-acetyltransferase